VGSAGRGGWGSVCRPRPSHYATYLPIEVGAGGGGGVDVMWEGELALRQVDTTLQHADHLTKALPRTAFEAHVRYTMGDNEN